jgi:cell division protease FtsH
MLARGDVEKIDLVKNKEIVRIYIYSDSLKKPYYQDKLKKEVPANNTSPLFEFQVTDWESFNSDLNNFYRENPSVKQVPTKNDQ